MDAESFREYCLSLPEAAEDFPFDETTLVFKVRSKLFCLIDIESFEFTNLKCDPEKAIELREQYAGVSPGWHMNKKHWNSVKLDGSVSDALLKEWIRDSYNLVVKSLPKKAREELNSKIS
ncbi:MAG: MmcQ/YjbR family DNA-binding protein [Cytophagales bacterium]|nr:MmcQ/YjbR family DNA-binding protein [Cytophagales bacterium]